MYSFILNMWIMRKIGEAKVLEYVTKGYITQFGSGYDFVNTASVGVTSWVRHWIIS